MRPQAYIEKTIQEFMKADGAEVAGVKDLAFDIGLNNDGTVNQQSSNRIRFTLRIARR